MELEITPELKQKYPDMKVLVKTINDVEIKRENKALEEFKKEITKEIKEGYDIDSLKDDTTVRCYRDFFWRIGIDPTKIRPASEALIRRIVAEKPLYKINTLVDAYNLASIKTGIPLAAFDDQMLEGELVMRQAKEGEKFMGIGMKEPKILKGTEVVISDQEKLVAIYPYRDADSTKITQDTKQVKLLVCGVPGIEMDHLKRAGDTAVEYITRFCNGREK